MYPCCVKMCDVQPSVVFAFRHVFKFTNSRSKRAVRALVRHGPKKQRVQGPQRGESGCSVEGQRSLQDSLMVAAFAEYSCFPIACLAYMPKTALQCWSFLRPLSAPHNSVESCDICAADSLTVGARSYCRNAHAIQAVERVVPDARKMAKTVLIGSPLTHERFNRRR